MSKKEEALEVEGVVTQALANTRFRVQLDDGPEVMAHVAGKIAVDSSSLGQSSGSDVDILTTAITNDLFDRLHDASAQLGFFGQKIEHRWRVAIDPYDRMVGVAVHSFQNTGTGQQGLGRANRLAQRRHGGGTHHRNYLAVKGAAPNFDEVKGLTVGIHQVLVEFCGRDGQATAVRQLHFYG